MIYSTKNLCNINLKVSIDKENLQVTWKIDHKIKLGLFWPQGIVLLKVCGVQEAPLCCNGFDQCRKCKTQGVRGIIHLVNHSSQRVFLPACKFQVANQCIRLFVCLWSACPTIFKICILQSLKTCRSLPDVAPQMENVDGEIMLIILFCSLEEDLATKLLVQFYVVF